MDLSRIEKKVREAEFYLDQMRRYERALSAPDEVFDYLLSAFLNAAKTVHFRFIHEQKPLFEPWLKAWETSLSHDDLRLKIFLANDRAHEVHRSGSSRQENLGAYAAQIDEGEVVALVRLPHPMPGAIAKLEYYFEVDGVPHTAVDACARYVTVLRRMVDEFKAAHS